MIIVGMDQFGLMERNNAIFVHCKKMITKNN
jgi:hypothetical protein